MHNLSSSSKFLSCTKKPLVNTDFILDQQGWCPKHFTHWLWGLNSDPYPTEDLHCAWIALSKLCTYLCKTLAFSSMASCVKERQNCCWADLLRLLLWLLWWSAQGLLAKLVQMICLSDKVWLHTVKRMNLQHDYTGWCLKDWLIPEGCAYFPWPINLVSSQRLRLSQDDPNVPFQANCTYRVDCPIEYYSLK